MSTPVHADDLSGRFQQAYEQLSDVKEWPDQDMQKEGHARTFRKFWKEKILNSGFGELSHEKDLDPIIRLIDLRAKGYAGGRWGAVALVSIYQSSWYRIFNDLHSQKPLQDIMVEACGARTDQQRTETLNRLWEVNEKNKNGFTGKNANAINALLALYDPGNWLSIVSLRHRFAIIRGLGYGDADSLQKAAYGEQIVRSNRLIVEKGQEYLKTQASPRQVSILHYEDPVKELWHPGLDPDTEEPIGPEEKEEPIPQTDQSSFAMEKHLEEFLISNWEKTDLGKRYDLIVQDGDMVSQQYRTDIGRIDILAQHKRSKDYVVIELKKGRSSDIVVGQILRYIGWVQKHLAGKKRVKGVIIALEDDEQLRYALSPLKNLITFYRYKVQFHLVG